MNDYNKIRNQKVDNSFNVQEKENIKSRINESKTRNMQNNKPNIEDINSKSNSLPKKDSLEKKSTLKDSINPKNIGRNALRNATNRALNKAENSDSDAARLASKGVRTARASVNAVKGTKKAATAIKFLATTPVGHVIILVGGYLLLAIILIILMTTLFQTVIDSLASKFGIDLESAYTVFAGGDITYTEGMSAADIEELFNSGNITCEDHRNIVTKLKNAIGKYNLGNTEEVCFYIKNKLDYIKNEYDIDTVSPGFPLSSLYYAYETRYANDGVSIDIEEENEEGEVVHYYANDFDSISALFSTGVLTIKDADNIFDNYVATIPSYTYYDYVYHPAVSDDPSTDANESKESYYSCEDASHNEEHELSDLKLKLYLRYGKEVATEYQNDLAKVHAYNATDNECRYLLRYAKPDMTKYETVADFNTKEDDDAHITISSGTYTYQTGFIYNRYLRFKGTHFDFMYAKDVEYIVSLIESRQDYVNYILGYPNAVKTNFNSQVYKICTYEGLSKNITDLKVKRVYPSGIDNSELSGKQIDDLIDFETFILGSTYAANPNLNNEEAIKALAIAIRSKILYKIETGEYRLANESGSNIVTISDIDYCNPDTGCEVYYDSLSNKVLLNKGDDSSFGSASESLAMLSGSSIYRRASSEVSGMYLIKEGKVYNPDFNSDTIRHWANKNTTYLIMLTDDYNDVTVNTGTCSFNGLGEWSTWKQYDASWGTITMGSGGNITQIGCLVTSTAMLIADAAPTLTIDNFNPGTFVDALKGTGALDYIGNLNTSTAISLATGGASFTYETISLTGSYEDKVSKIAEYMNNGYSIILRVKSEASARISGSNQHWVYITGIENNELIMADPASRSTRVRDRYINEGIVSMKVVKYN